MLRGREQGSGCKERFPKQKAAHSGGPEVQSARQPPFLRMLWAVARSTL